MKHCLTAILLTVVLCVNGYAQNFSDQVSLLYGDDTTVALQATAAHSDGKKAVELAIMSAFNALFHSGVEGVNDGAPMVAQERKDYDYRFYNEKRYVSYLADEVKTLEKKKISGMQRVTVRVSIRIKALKSDLERNSITLNPKWADAKAVKATAALNPTIVVVPYVDANDGYSFEAMRRKVEQQRVYRHVITQVQQEFQNHGYKTRDFITQLENSRMSSMLQEGNQADVATMLVQQLPGDIVVTVEVLVTRTGSTTECTLNLRAVEKQTAGQLAAAPFPSGAYMTRDTIELASYAMRKISADFFSQLSNSFENMVKQGREVNIEIGLSETVTDWDFEQDSPETGEYFKDALDDWLREHSFQGVYDMSMSTDQYISLRINIPLWDEERNRSYGLQNFGSEVRRFFKQQLGQYYKASVTSMGQKLMVTVE